jgi:hypothetical protein
MSLSEAVLSWREFYLAVATAGAAFLGLVFLAVSLYLDRHPLDNRTRVLGTISTVSLLHPLVASLVMLLPVIPVVQGIGLVWVAVSALAITIRIRYVKTPLPSPPVSAPGPRPSEPGSLARAYRHVAPLAAALILAIGGLGMIVDSRLGLYAPPLFVFLMFGIGTEYAWALLLGSRSANEPGAGEGKREPRL